jgi:hypothetical protein
LFRPGGSRIVDSRGDLVCMVVPEGQVFRADFSQSSGVERCFFAGSSSELWKWHRKLGHLSFDLLSRLSKLNLVRGFPRLRLEKELVCALCRHAKMVASSHPPLTDVMTERPCELLHMDLVGVVGGVVVDTVLICLEHDAVGSFDPAVAPWVGDRGVVDVNEVVLAEVLEERASESFPRSVMILLGTPKRCLISLMNLTASSDVTFAICQTSIYLVNLSTATRICL